MSVEEIVLQHPGKGFMTVGFDQKELVVVLFEAMAHQRRPEGLHYEAAWAEIKEQAPESFAVCNHVALRVLDWLGERFRDAKAEPPQ